MATGLTFVSYSRSDSEFAVRLASDLRAKGVEVWVDQLDIEAGARWDLAVEAGLKRSAQLLVILTPKSVESHNVLDEVSFALDEGKTVLPVLVESCSIPMRMRRFQHVDFTREYEQGLIRLVGALGVAQPAPSAPTGPSAPPAHLREDSQPVPAPIPPTDAAPSVTAGDSVPDFASTNIEFVTNPAAASEAGHRRLVRITGTVVAVFVVTAVIWGLSNRSSTTSNRSPESTAVPVDQPAPNSGTAAPATDAARDQEMQALRTLTQQLGARTTLDPSDLYEVVSAQVNACPAQAPDSPCNTAASALVESMVTTVCRRQIGEPLKAHNKEAAVMREVKARDCRQAYLNIFVDRLEKTP